jgi:hypothetical protein
MVHRLGDFVLQCLMFSFKFRKMRLHGHVGWLLEILQITPLAKSVCHEVQGKSIAAFFASQHEAHCSTLRLPPYCMGP